MGRIGKNLRITRQALLALIVTALVPAALEAAGIGFRNDTNQAVYVQGSMTVNGQIKRGPLIYIKPGQTAWDVNLPGGNRTISVYSSANQLLFQEIRQFQGIDQFYSIVTAPTPRGQPRVDLKGIDINKMPASGK